MAQMPTVEEQARTRAALRELERDLDSNKQSLTETRSTGLAEAQKRANELYAISQTESRGAALDATILNKVATLGAEQAGNLEKKSEGFLRSLRQKFGMGGSTPRINWCIRTPHRTPASPHASCAPKTRLLMDRTISYHAVGKGSARLSTMRASTRTCRALPFCWATLQCPSSSSGRNGSGKSAPPPSRSRRQRRSKFRSSKRHPRTVPRCHA
eukprot:scaffold136931_cov32-Tisochrysis_lutea.AAC.8